MLERLLIGVLALGVSHQSHNWQNTEKSSVGTEKVLIAKEVDIEQFQDPARLHVGMLTISLIVCLGYGGYVIWSHRTEKDEFFGYMRNLIIALACRIFFTILFDGIIILGASFSSEGGNTLLAFECISQNLVIAFWLMLTVYLHARVQRKFNSEPSLTLYEYGIPGVAVFFAFVWIFAMQAVTSEVWSFSSPSLSQWIVASLRLLYLLIQLGVVFDMGRIMMKISIDNDSVSLLRKAVAILLVLVFLFWLQFGLSLERLAATTTQSYQYFDYFIDGSHGALVCLALFFFYKWVSTFLNRIPSIMTESEETPRQIDEVLPTEGQGISTIDRLFTKKESGRWKNSDDAVESRDVVYSSIVEPHRLQKTLELYKRLNIIPSSQVTVVEGEEFFDCQRRVSASEIGDFEKADFRSVISEDSKSQLIPQRTSSVFKTNNTNENIQKKNAFYASKYLILDSKKNNIPNNLETRSYVTSTGRESIKKISENEFFSNLDILKSSELVKKWLNDHSEDLQVKKPEIQKHHQESTTEEKENSNWAQVANQCNVTTTSTSTPPKTVLDINKYDSEHSEKESSVKTQILTETKACDFQPIYQRKPSITAESDASKENHRNTEIISFESGEFDKQSNVLNEKSDEDFSSNGSRQSDPQHTSTVDYTQYTILYYTYSQMYNLVCYTYYIIHTILYYISSQAYSVVTKRLNESFENIEEYQPIQRESKLNEKDVTKLVSQTERHYEEQISSFGKTDYQDECEVPAVPSGSKDKPVSAEDSYKPFNLESLKLDHEVEIPQGEVKFLEDEQSLQDLFQNKEPARQESPSTPIQQVKKSEEPQLEHSIALPQDSVTEKEEPSSESEFSVERTPSSSSSVSIDKYYARLRSNEEIINKYNHPFISAKKKRPFLK